MTANMVTSNENTRNTRNLLCSANLLVMMLIMMMDARWRSATIRDFVRFRFPVICENVLTIFPEAILDSLMERQQIWRHSLAVYLDAFSQNRNLHRDLIF